MYINLSFINYSVVNIKYITLVIKPRPQHNLLHESGPLDVLLHLRPSVPKIPFSESSLQ